MISSRTTFVRNQSGFNWGSSRPFTTCAEENDVMPRVAGIRCDRMFFELSGFSILPHPCDGMASHPWLRSNIHARDVPSNGFFPIFHHTPFLSNRACQASFSQSAPTPHNPNTCGELCGSLVVSWLVEAHYRRTSTAGGSIFIMAMATKAEEGATSDPIASQPVTRDNDAPLPVSLGRSSPGFPVILCPAVPSPAVPPPPPHKEISPWIPVATSTT